jgi:hypothetical protein
LFVTSATMTEGEDRRQGRGPRGGHMPIALRCNRAMQKECGRAHDSSYFKRLTQGRGWDATFKWLCNGIDANGERNRTKPQQKRDADRSQSRQRRPRRLPPKEVRGEHDGLLAILYGRRNRRGTNRVLSPITSSGGQTRKVVPGSMPGRRRRSRRLACHSCPARPSAGHGATRSAPAPRPAWPGPGQARLAT